MIERATPRWLCAKPTHDHVLVGIEQPAPFGIAAGQGKLRFHPNASASYLIDGQRIHRRVGADKPDAPARRDALSSGLLNMEIKYCHCRTLQHVLFMRRSRSWQRSAVLFSVLRVKSSYCGLGAVLDLGFAAVRGAPSVPQRT